MCSTTFRRIANTVNAYSSNQYRRGAGNFLNQGCVSENKLDGVRETVNFFVALPNAPLDEFCGKQRFAG